MTVKHIIIGLLLAQLTTPFVFISNGLTPNSTIGIFDLIWIALVFSTLPTLVIVFPILVLLNYFKKLNFISIFFVAWLVPVIFPMIDVFRAISRCNTMNPESKFYSLYCPPEYLNNAISGASEFFLMLVPGTFLAYVIFMSYKIYLSRRSQSVA